MRYDIYTTDDEFDGRELQFGSMDEFRAHFKHVGECDLEQEAADLIHEMYPDGMGMPAPVKLGKGTAWMLGVVSSIHNPRDEGGYVVPMFSVIIHAVAENDRERKRLESHKHWSPMLWRLAPVKPHGDSVVMQVEIRTTERAEPLIADASVGRTKDKRAVVHVKLGDAEMSIVFMEKGVNIVKLERIGTPPGDFAGEGNPSS